MLKEKTLTQKQIISKISKFDWFKKGNISDIMDFRKNQKNTIIKLIENKQFSKSDFDILTDAFCYFEELCANVYMVESDKLGLDGTELNKKDFMLVFIDICKSYITLLIQFNVKFDKYLKYFNPESSYYKKMKALSLIRQFNGSKKDVGGLFYNVSLLLGSAIKLDPASYEPCCKLGIECIDLVFNTNRLEPLSNNIEDNIEKIKFICENGNYDFVIALKNSEAFHSRFYKGLIVYGFDKRNSSKEGVNNIIKEILSDWNIHGENEIKIMKLLQPDFDRYCEIEQTLNNIKLDYKKSFDLYIKNFNSLESSDEFPISDNHKFGLLWNKIRIKELVYGKDWQVLTCNKEESEDIIGFMNQCIGCYDINKNKIIIGCTFDISEDDANKIHNILKANYKYKFKVCKLNDELIHIHELIQLDNKESEIENKLSSFAYELYWNVYECIKKLDIESPKISMFRNNFKDTDYNENKNNNELNPDKEKIRNVKKNLNELDSVIDGYKKAISSKDSIIAEYKKDIDRQYSEVLELKKEINSLKELLKENGIRIEKDSEESNNLIKKRSHYKILIIGGSDKSINGYNELWNDPEFINKIENDYHLKQDSFKLKGNYNKQQHDKKLAKEVMGCLDRGRIVIALQTDHETALQNVLKKSKYNLQVTRFGDPLIGGGYNDQTFSRQKFEDYLELALENYERKAENDLISLT